MSSYVVVKQHKNLAIYNIFGPFDSYQVANDVMKEKRVDYAGCDHLTFEVWVLDSNHEDLRGNARALTFTPDPSLLARLNQ